MKRGLVARLIVVCGLVVFCLFQIFPVSQSFHLGIDLAGGTQLTVGVDTSGLTEEQKAPAVEGATEVIRTRLDDLGLAGMSIQRLNRDRILVQIPGIDSNSVTMVKDLIHRQARLEFRLVEKVL